jgi:hypothetical protein
MTDIEQQLTDHLHRRAADAVPRYDLEAVEQGIRPDEYAHRDDHSSRRPRTGILVGAIAAALVVVALSAMLVRDDQSTNVTAPPIDTSRPVETITPPVDTSVPESVTELPPLANFLGRWTAIDTDGSSMTMEIDEVDDVSAEMTILDDAAGVCSGTPSTMTGSGRTDSSDDLVIAAPELICDNGSEPLPLTPPIEEQIRDLTFAHDPASDSLTDTLGIIWRRPGAPESSAEDAAPGAMWPQSSLDEVREAQERADAGDPAFTWQTDPELSSAGEEWWGHLRDEGGSEIVERFLRDELGWEQFLFNPYQPTQGAARRDGTIGGIVYLRCVPGETNPLYPTAPEGPQEAPGAERCAPTIDDFRYEAVQFNLSQPDQQDRTGVWVVTDWRITAPFTQTDPQVVETDATARLQSFLAARIAGEGAEGYVDGNLEEVPLLYATSAGAPYERSEIEPTSEPLWPDGDMTFTVRLFAEGGQTVVEQQLHLLDGSLVLDATDTTENGAAIAVPYVLFDGDVTLSAADPWMMSWRFALALTLGDQAEERVELVADSLPVGCARDSVSSGASVLAASIHADPDLQVTAPVQVTVGGIEALALDITLAEGASVCEVTGGPGRGDLVQGSRMLLYLIDLPEGLATRTLAIAIVAPDDRFEAVREAATPIIDSIRFNTDEQ